MQIIMLFTTLFYCFTAPYSDRPRLWFDVLSIDFVRVTNCFYDYDYNVASGFHADEILGSISVHYYLAVYRLSGPRISEYPSCTDVPLSMQLLA